jgi:hypothetical protein
MAEDLKLHGQINPMVLFSLEPVIPGIDVSPSPDAILHDLCAPGVKSSVDAMLTRCGQVAQAGNALAIVPSEKSILTKVVWPLRNAKACYVMGNYLGTIALCGMMTEMAAIVIFEVASPVVRGKPLDRRRQVEMYGCRFELLGQERRVEELKKLGVIRGGLVDAFDTVRVVRRRYLHIWSHDHGAVARDAARVFQASMVIAVALMGVRFEEGKALLTPAMVRYLKKRGLYEPMESHRPSDSAG